MNILYLCKISEFQAKGNQIDIPKKIAIDFFNIPKENIENGQNISINICHASNPKLFELIELQPATNMRWSTKLNTFLSNNSDPLTANCILVFEKLVRSYCIHTIKTTDSKYDSLLNLFEESEKHMLIQGTSVIKNDVAESYSKEELGAILKGLYDELGSKGIHLFGLKYGKFLQDYRSIEIVNGAGINESYIAELNKMKNLYSAIKENKYGICFFEDAEQIPTVLNTEEVDESRISLFEAMRTKPFLLLAGISGTGKSRIVKQLAFESCPDKDTLRSDKTAPGNYELIEVKPNWHDSTELLGYESEIGSAHYVVTPFIKFLVKAMRYPDVPFFVCMDEMNLAPVEQYFAEFLSVLESRKLLLDGTITSEPIIKASIFKKYGEDLMRELFDIKAPKSTSYGGTTADEPTVYGYFNTIYDRLKSDGLRLPGNLIVVGTVNMDETTHQFSRKVIDRAMTIEMNIEDAETPFKDFFSGPSQLGFREQPLAKELFLPKVVQASEAMERLSDDDVEYLKTNVPTLLYSLNTALNGTQFKIAYRVQNELVLFFYSLREEKPEESAETLLAQAMDAILMMKVLPRIEGDEDLLEKPLKALAEFTANYKDSSKKIAEMQERLPRAHFTSYWP